MHLSEQSSISEARRRAVAAANVLGFSEEDSGKVAIVVTEIGTNLIKHARGGSIFIRVLHDSHAVEILGVDAGPGMRDVSACIQDGHSSSGTAGNGLGAITRLSSVSDIYTIPGKGTVIRAVCTAASAAALPPGAAFNVGYVCTPKPGEAACGDSLAYAGVKSGAVRILVVDGLGHGLLAAEASQAAVDTFHRTLDVDFDAVMTSLHAALRPTRGAAIAIAEIRPASNIVRFCGIGNVAGVIARPEKSSHLVSMNGIAGHQARSIRSFEYPWSPESLLIMHTDGLSSRWDLDSSPGLRMRSPSVISGVLYRDARRTSDDATVLVASTRAQNNV